MARFEYDEVNADYLRIKFKCTCGEINTTDYIAAKESCKKNEVTYRTEHAYRCPHCKKLYNILLIDNMFEAVGEIFPLSDEELKEVHEVPFEYASKNQTLFNSISWIDAHDGFNKVKDCLNVIDALDETTRTFLYEMIYCNIISIMDSCCQKIITYLSSIVPPQVTTDETDQMKKQKKQRNVSCQNVLSINAFFKENYNQELPNDEVLVRANYIRNSIIHRLGRDNDGYQYSINKSDVEEVTTYVRQYLNRVADTVITLLAEQIVINQK